MIRCNIAILDEQIKEIGRHIISMPIEGTGWFERRGIDCNGKASFCLLNKKKEAEINHWNMLCNGSVFNFAGTCLSLPVFHIRKQSDNNCILNYRECDLVENITGLTLSTFWPWGDLGFMACNTKTAISTYEADCVLGTELRQAKTKAKRLNINRNEFSPDTCLTFKIKEEDLYVVHGINVKTYLEFTEDELDILAQRIGCMRPLKFSCPDGWKDICHILQTHQETFLLRDKTTGERGTLSIKLSRSNLLKTGKYKYLIPYWQTNNQWQVIAEYPFTRKQFDIIEEQAKRTVTKTLLIGEPWASINMPKQDIIESMKKSNVPGWMFKFIMGMATHHKERWPDYVLDSLKKLTYKQIMCIFGLEDPT